MIFHKKIESFPNLEYFLQNYSTPFKIRIGFRLWINENSIRDDIETLRNLSTKNYQEDNGKSKYKKAKID
jgi:hypothetical protein